MKCAAYFLAMIISLLSFIGPTDSKAQGMYLDSLDSGLGISSAAANNKDGLTFSLSAGVTLRSLLDIGFSVGRSTLHQSDLRIVSYSYSVMFHILHLGDREAPFSISPVYIHQHDEYSEESIKGDSDNLGVILFIKLKNNLYTKIIFEAGLILSKRELTGRSLDDKGLLYNLGLNFCTSLRNHKKIVVNPYFIFDKPGDELRPTYGVSVSLVFESAAFLRSNR